MTTAPFRALLLFAVWSLPCTGPVLAQTTLRVMSYNLLAFPEPVPAGRQDTLARIVDHVRPDLLLVQEIETLAGANLVLNDALNTNGVTRFSRADWVPQISDPGSTVKLQQLLYYDHERFTLAGQQTLTTAVRDINVYTLYVNDVDLPQSQDTTWITVYVAHLKASTGVVNEFARQQMAQVLMDHLNSLPPGRNVIVGGDMNIYAGDEGAYTTFMTAGVGNPLDDPLTLPISWNGNSAMAQHHTQSTRTNTLYGEGAGGGLDDRFDMILLSQTAMNGGDRLSYVAGSCRPVGNSGTCFNDNITDCGTGQTPFAVLRALYYMSDHLPVILDLSFDGVVAGGPALEAPSPVALRHAADGTLLLDADRPGTGVLERWDAQGRLLERRTVRFAEGTSAWPAERTAPGLQVAVLHLEHRSLRHTLIVTP
ncbi:MAG TPA: endonuclease/exonuclease/phosphatase family protein [Flavobacteriales bacterium]|nr:endonuclease/exonuclease/phosphatase family protein [Flavobacteriales bacterium]HMR28921.1 endonuclease/exonuclease/phosphatase family protein [Flavobacteriales bacterium]